MKDFIVLIATIILGLVLAVVILNFRDNANDMAESTETALDSLDGAIQFTPDALP